VDEGGLCVCVCVGVCRCRGYVWAREGCVCVCVGVGVYVVAMCGGRGVCVINVPYQLQLIWKLLKPVLV